MTVLSDLGPGLLPACAAGHRAHDIRSLHIELGESIPDWPTVPHSFRHSFTIDVFDADRYSGTTGYCPGDGELPRSLFAHSMWEAFESVLVLAILAQKPGLVLDFGANVGWFSILALLSGCPVEAVEADPDFAVLLRTNLTRAALDGWTIHHAWVGADTPPVSELRPVRMVKADVEGNEPYVVQLIEPLLAAGLVDYLLLEVSPCFGSVHWLTTLTGHGYVGYRIPDKGFDVEAFAADPLGSTLKLPLGEVDFDQANILFVRGDL